MYISKEKSLIISGVNFNNILKTMTTDNNVESSRNYGVSKHLSNDKPHYPVADIEQQYHDRRIFMFSNCEEMVFSVDVNNIPQTIRNIDIGESSDGAELLYKITNNRDIAASTRGVCILETIYIQQGMRANPECVYEYISNNRDLYTNIQGLEVNSWKEIGGKQLTSIQLVTFIPEQILLKQKNMYIPNINIVLTIGALRRKVLHPNSLQAMIEDNRLIATPKQWVGHSSTLNINDSESDSPYYMASGNDIFKVYPTNDKTKPNGFSYIVYCNDVKVLDTNGPISQLDKIGIYKTYEQARTKNDLSLLIEEEKINLEKEKITYSKLKTKTEYDNLVYKNKLENSNMNKKHRHEIAMQKSKLVSDALKLTGMFIVEALALYAAYKKYVK